MRNLLLATALIAGVTTAASAETKMLHAAIDAAQEGSGDGKSVTSGATGTADMKLDTATHKLTYTVTYAGLTGPAAAGHLHGPADMGKNAGVLVPFKGSLASPIKGTVTLTAAQQADVLAGKSYVNIHTAQYPGGEIRGQVVAN